jgi:hypothetical protein
LADRYQTQQLLPKSEANVPATSAADFCPLLRSFTFESLKKNQPLSEVPVNEQRLPGCGQLYLHGRTVVAELRDQLGRQSA